MVLTKAWTMEYGGDGDDHKDLQFGTKVVVNIFICYNGRKKT